MRIHQVPPGSSRPVAHHMECRLESAFAKGLLVARHLPEPRDPAAARAILIVPDGLGWRGTEAGQLGPAYASDIRVAGGIGNIEFVRRVGPVTLRRACIAGRRHHGLTLGGHLFEDRLFGFVESCASDGLALTPTRRDHRRGVVRRDRVVDIVEVLKRRVGRLIDVDRGVGRQPGKSSMSSRPCRSVTLSQGRRRRWWCYGWRRSRKRPS